MFGKIGNKIHDYILERKISKVLLEQEKQYISQEIVKELRINNSHGYLYKLLFDKAFSLIGKEYLLHKVYREIQRDDLWKVEDQQRLLKEIVSNLAQTKIGVEYEIDELKKDEHLYRLFAERTPIVEYDAYKEQIEQAKEEEDVIWPGKIKMFSASSGTTSKRKHIPVTWESMKSTKKAGLHMLAEYFKKHPDTKIFEGDFWPLIGSIQEHTTRKTVADISALLLLSRGRISEEKYTMDKSILLNPSWEKKKREGIKNADPNRTITMMGVTSWGHKILKEMQDTCPEKFKTMTENMEVFFGGGVNEKPFIDFFDTLGIRYMSTYNASEGFFGYQDIMKYGKEENETIPYKLLTNHGIFYEFIPFNTHNFDHEGNVRKNPEIHPLWSIYTGDKKKYAVVITTNAGLLRYVIGDVIEFVDNEYRFNIVGRTRQSLNIMGEEIMETHTNKAINVLNETYKCNITEYTVGPDKEKDPTCHEWIIETTNGTCGEDIIAEKIDEILKEANADYEAKRKGKTVGDRLLQIPKITLVKQGTFHAWLQSKNKLGGQHKVPKLAPHRNHIEEILSIKRQNSLIA